MYSARVQRWSNQRKRRMSGWEFQPQPLGDQQIDRLFHGIHIGHGVDGGVQSAARQRSASPPAPAARRATAAAPTRNRLGGHGRTPETDGARGSSPHSRNFDVALRVTVPQLRSARASVNGQIRHLRRRTADRLASACAPRKPWPPLPACSCHRGNAPDINQLQACAGRW